MDESKEYCRFCFNARIFVETSDEDYYHPITEENDLSYHGVGDAQDTSDGYRIMIASGGGKPPRVEFDWWFEKRKEWINVARYYPKYCPECGRRINEYDNLHQ